MSITFSTSVSFMHLHNTLVFPQMLHHYALFLTRCGVSSNATPLRSSLDTLRRFHTCYTTALFSSQAAAFPKMLHHYALFLTRCGVSTNATPLRSFLDTLRRFHKCYTTMLFS
jgi:hypothetical protein